MTMTSGAAFRDLLRRMVRAGGRRRVAKLAGLQLGAAVSESLGLAMLLPLLRMIQLPGGDAPAELGESAGTGFAPLDRLIGALDPAAGLIAVLLVFVVLTVIRGLLLYGREVHSFHLTVDLAAQLRADLFGAAARAPWRVLASEPRGHLLGLLTTEVDRIVTGTVMLLRLPALGVMAVAQITVAALISPTLTLAALAIGGLSGVAVRRRSRSSFAQGTRQTGLHAAASREVRDFLDGLKPAKGQGVEARHAAVSATALRETGLGMLSFVRASANARLMMQVVGVIALSGLVVVGALILKVPGPELILLAVICGRLLPMAQEFQQSAQRVAHMLPALVAVNAAAARLARQAGPAVARPALPAADHAPEIRLKGVRLSHPGDPAAPETSSSQTVLDGVDASFPAGSVTAIIGPSGAGKTTLIDLLLGLLPPDDGTVTFDGRPLDEALAAAWRPRAGWVPQETFLTDASLRQNLLWSADPERHASDDTALMAAIEAAGLAPVVAGLPEGLDTPLGDRGSRLSGGERQRVTIARALIRQPRLLLLDEPSSALDAETEQRLCDTLATLKGRTTVVVITHRPAILEVADQVLRLEDGRFVTGS
ncbi:ABC transporter ATP-binding protein (plasmid) [Tistrella mobilis]|uniref:ATP-binding cassette domain-containing protein n=1 Tax=Tistrella mobilis TaxID=171437 RepID=UPI003557AA74